MNDHQIKSHQLDGFLLSRQWQDYPQLHLIFWLSTNEGPVRVDVAGQEAVLFVCAAEIEAARRLLTAAFGQADSKQQKNGIWHDKPVALKNFNQQTMHAIYFSKQTLLYKARTALRKKGLTPYEADIDPCDRFLMERFIGGSLRLYGELIAEEGFKRIKNPVIKQLNYPPQFKVVSLDIETSMTGDKLYSIALLAKHTVDSAVHEEKVFMIGAEEDFADSGKPDYLMLCDDETSLMTHFLSCFNRMDPDIIIGWAVINFDLRFLQRKADQLHIPLRLGRAGSECHWRQSRDNDERYSLTLPGRLVLDGIDTMKSATYSFESFSLQNVASEILQRGKLIHDVDNRGEEITRQFLNDKRALAAYNLEDCQLVWDIFQATRLVDFAVERARLTGLAMDRFGGSVASFDHRYLPRLHRAGFVAPNLQQNPQGIGSPGGYVMNSRPGMYDHVLVLDFKSLYPSIISTFKIDPLGLIEGLRACPNEAVCDQQQSAVFDIEKVVPGFNGAVFSKEINILPDIINELWRARDQAKKHHNAAMSQAIKILMNSFYGVLGTPGCRFFDSRLPSSITLRGHDILTRSREFIEARGDKVIYGDTDSVFVWVQGQKLDSRQVQQKGKQLARDLNRWWTDNLKREYQIDSKLEIEFETHFRRFVMPTIRGSDKGSKKRYAGLVETPGDQGSELSMVFKGLETVRTDWTQVAREFQQELYRRIFYNEPWKDYIKTLVDEIRSGQRDHQLVYRKRLRRRLSDYEKNVPPHVRAARLADAQRQADGLPLKYQRGGWIRYVMTSNGPEPVEHICSPLDYDFYIERQIQPVADGILQFLDASFGAITNKQMQMF